MSRARSAPPELPGFTLVEGIGSGGFADVFLYTQHHPSRPVAVKVLRSEFVSDTNLRLFANEADVMAQVSEHPYIVTIHASGISPDGRPYIVMEHYPGEHFGIRARGGRLSVADVLRVGVQVASAVETAHRAGILHRDIKPANVLTSSYGRPGLTDFGIASVATEGGVEAVAGVTVAFSSPEVLLDIEHNGSESSDIASFSATLFSLLAGHSPYWVPGGDNGESAVMARVVTNQVPRLARPDVPASLANLLAQGMAADPSHRPPSALAFARALQSIEQELTLAPTAIEVRDEIGAAIGGPPRDWSTVDDDESTRRSTPQVVDPSPPATPSASPVTAAASAPEVPAPAAPAAPPAAVAPVDPSPWAPGAAPPAPAAPTGPTVDVDDPETVQKRPEPPAPVRPTAADRLTGRSGGPDVVAIAAAVVVALVVVSVVVVLVTRSMRADEDAPVVAGPGPGTTAVTVVVDDPPAAPTDVTGTIDAAGTLTITFEAPTTSPAPTFRVTRSGARWPSDEPWFDTPETTVQVEGFAAGEAVCFSVATIRSSAISDPSPDVCAVRGGQG